MEKLTIACVSTSKCRLEEKQITLSLVLEKEIVLELNVSAHKDGDRGDKSCCGKGSKDKLEHPDMMMTLQRDQADTSPSTAPNSGLWDCEFLEEKLSCMFVSLTVSTDGTRGQ